MDAPIPSPDLIERFRRDVTALGAGDARIGLAVSGGGDSLALLLLAAAAFPGSVAAASVDHGLRPEAADEAALVRTICAGIAVPHSTLQARVDTRAASLQRAAREARYAALSRWLGKEGLELLATAHHADDQAETLVMRLLRGSGMAGLAAVRARVPVPVPGSRATLIRPLLGWRRAELRALVAAAGLTPAEDPSNSDPRFDRVRIRRHLADSPWLDPVPVARSAAALAEGDEALEWTAERLRAERVRSEGAKLVLDPAGIPAELKRRLLVRLLAECAPGAAAPRGEEVSRLIVRLDQGATATLAGVKCRGGAYWTFEREGPRSGRPARVRSAPSSS